jgi:anti-sigma regulatory factor (Ser/Thr protein kinase)
VVDHIDDAARDELAGEGMTLEKPMDNAAFAHRVWPAQAGALTLIRGDIRRWLGPLEVMPEVEDDLVLAVNEAASNVIDHAYRTPGDSAVIEVFFWTEPGAVLLEVVDHGQWRPPGPHSTGLGRGIEIMQRLVEGVLIRYDARGTRVLLRHSLPGHPRAVTAHRPTPAARALGPMNEAARETSDKGLIVAATNDGGAPAELVVDLVTHRAETTP